MRSYADQRSAVAQQLGLEPKTAKSKAKAKPKKPSLRKPVAPIAERVRPDGDDLKPEACKAIPNHVADQHLIYRCLAAYYAELAGDVGHLTDLAIEELEAVDIAESFHEPIRGEIPVAVEGHGDVWAAIDETKRMPIIELRIGGDRAKFRYNPKADRLQRIG